MKKWLFLLCAPLLGYAIPAIGQCTDATLNWDYLDFLPSAGNGSFTGLASSQTQYFTLGTQRVTLTHNYTGSNALGENTGHTGAGASYGGGADVQFNGNGTITVSFQSAVSNIRFALHDIDGGQQVQFGATEGATARTISLTTFTGSVLTVNNNNATNASITAAANSDAPDGGITGSVNVQIAGPLTSFTITVANSGSGGCNASNGRNCTETNGQFWLTDITACAGGSFPATYFRAAQPFTGQPGYVLLARDNSVFYVDPATGKAKLLFTDPGHTNLNSLAYDPVNRYVYYVYSLTGPISNGTATTNASNKALRRYDYNQDTFGVVLSNVTTIGAHTYEAGVESGSAAFYDGSLYLGIEAPSSSSSYESVVWKLDFNSQREPFRATQVFGIDGAGHDWADIAVNNGVLYDFDGSSTNAEFFHANMLTGITTQFAPATGLVPRQAAVDWNGQVYHVGQAATGSTALIAPYNYNGGVNTALQYPITYNGVALSGSFGDAAEAFKPRVDFGDAPSSYDPANAPAMHERNADLRLGSQFDDEWSRVPTIPADGDGADEDGVPTVRSFNARSGVYYTDVKVWNRTGAAATLIGWLDFNGNGLFDAAEAVSQTINSSATVQDVQLFWSGIPQTLVNASTTYMRLRLTSAANNLTAAMASGFMSDGEVEDYTISINSMVLATQLTDFTARVTPDSKALLSWAVADEEPGMRYQVEKSFDGSTWTLLYNQAGSQNVKTTYTVTDAAPGNPQVYYRIRYISSLGRTSYSAVNVLFFARPASGSVVPNPVVNHAVISFSAQYAEAGLLVIVNASGAVVHQKSISIQKGLNKLELDGLGKLPAGVYQVRVMGTTNHFSSQLLLARP